MVLKRINSGFKVGFSTLRFGKINDYQMMSGNILGEKEHGF